MTHSRHCPTDTDIGSDCQHITVPQPGYSGTRQSSAHKFPLDLSIRSSLSSSSTSESSSNVLFPGRGQHQLSSSLSSEVSESVKHNLVVSSPSLLGPDLLTSALCVCPLCQQAFSLHNRLAKHLASRHKEQLSVNQARS